MKAITIITAVLSIFMFLTACNKDDTIVPSNTITTHEYNVKGYNQLQVEDAFQVEVQFSSDVESILVEANDNLHSHIIIEKKLEELIIRLEDNISLEGNPATLKVYISTDYIFSFEASGASMIALLDTIGGNNVTINLSGASQFSGPSTGNEVNAILSGASILTLTGSSAKFNLDASGASIAQGYDFQTNWLHVKLSGASSSKTTVNNKLDVWASGASTVYYKGDGEIHTQELSDASQIIKVD